VVFRYMVRIQANMTRPMLPPIVSVMKMRFTLNRTWLDS
jgi:hypothetical protein